METVTAEQLTRWSEVLAALLKEHAQMARRLRADMTTGGAAPVARDVLAEMRKALAGSSVEG